MTMLSLRDVLSIKMVPIKKDRGSFAMGECPECHHNTAKYSFVNPKDCYNCPACGVYHGGVRDLWAYWSGISAPTREETLKLASEDMKKYLYGETTQTKERRKKIAEEIQKSAADEIEMAPISVRNRTYRRLLSKLTLSEKHKNDLLKRGLSEDDIVRCEFRTLPDNYARKLCKELQDEGFVLKGVPGFWTKGEDWVFGYGKGNGFLIPQKDRKGRIQGFQIRNDLSDPKYYSLSSANKENGTRSGSFVHVATKDYVKPMDFETVKVVLTEGPLKGDVANALAENGSVFLAIPGVNAISHLEKTLRDMKKDGLGDIYIAFDIDYQTNPNVERALKNLYRMLKRLGLKPHPVNWASAYEKNPNCKGIDDFMLARKRGEV